jgi:hypothetical protein
VAEERGTHYCIHKLLGEVAAVPRYHVQRQGRAAPERGGSGLHCPGQSTQLTYCCIQCIQVGPQVAFAWHGCPIHNYQAGAAAYKAHFLFVWCVIVTAYCARHAAGRVHIVSDMLLVHVAVL